VFGCAGDGAASGEAGVEVVARAGERVVFGLLVSAFIAGLGLLAAFVPLGHGFAPKGGGWFFPEVAGGPFTLHPLPIAVPAAACFVLGLADWRRPWRVEHLDLLALAGFFPVAMLLSDDISAAGLWLAAVCLCWLFVRMLGACFGKWPMPQLRPSIGSRWLRAAVGILLLVRIGSAAAGNILDVGQASSLGAVLAGPRRAPDLPPRLLRTLRLLRVHPVRGRLAAGTGTHRDAAACGVLRRGDARGTV
jgi:hypothetical protein